MQVLMAENTVKVDISFQSLLEAISSLGIAEKAQTLGNSGG